jgi:hypothetical protein
LRGCEARGVYFLDVVLRAEGGGLLVEDEGGSHAKVDRASAEKMKMARRRLRNEGARCAR